MDSMKSKRSVSVIIPAYNEEQRIASTITRVIEYFSGRGQEYEIIVVDDGSTDKTLDIIKRECHNRVKNLHFLYNIKNMGKGFSIKRGMMFARGEIAFFTDADLSTPIEEFSKLESAIFEEGYDIAIGSRGLPGSRKTVPQGFFRDRMGKLFGLLVRFILLKDIYDSQCGFKAFRRDCAHFVFYWQTIFRFGFDPEILYIAKLHNYKIKEIPVEWGNNFDSKLDPVKDTLMIGFELFKVKLKSILGHYTL